MRRSSSLASPDSFNIVSAQKNTNLVLPVEPGVMLRKTRQAGALVDYGTSVGVMISREDANKTQP